MKPHPRIRKTIKWGGLAVCILLSGLWAASERWWVGRLTARWCIELHPGGVSVSHDWGQFDAPLSGWRFGNAYPWLGRAWWVEWEQTNRGTGLLLPLWMPLTISAAFTATAWRLDALARRRANKHACANCGYDRAGLAPEAKCPECGSAPIVA